MNEFYDDEPLYLFEGETLTGWGLHERLLAAQQVVSGLTVRLNEAHDSIAHQKMALEHRQGIIDRLVDDMRDLARDLARVAGDTHREKNEAILAVIYRLLSAEPPKRHYPDIDDLPF